MKKELYDDMYRQESFQWSFRAKYDIVIKTLINEGLTDVRNPLICDFGCGCGFMMKLLSAYGTVVGFDFSDDAIEYSRQTFTGEAELRQIDLEKYNEMDRFDYGVVLDVIEHIKHDELALKNIYGSVKAGGVVVITVPALMSLWSQHDENCMHWRRYGRAELEDKVKKAGFKVKYCGFYNFYAFFPAYIVRKFQKIFRIDNSDDHIESGFKDNWLNRFMCGVMHHEGRMMNKGYHYPIGFSLMCVAVKE